MDAQGCTEAHAPGRARSCPGESRFGSYIVEPGVPKKDHHRVVRAVESFARLASFSSIVGPRVPKKDHNPYVTRKRCVAALRAHFFHPSGCNYSFLEHSSSATLLYDEVLRFFFEKTHRNLRNSETVRRSSLGTFFFT